MTIIRPDGKKKIFTACGAGFVLEASGMLFTCGGDGRPRLSFHRSSFLSTSLNRWMSLLAILSAVYKKKGGCWQCSAIAICSAILKRKRIFTQIVVVFARRLHLKASTVIIYRRGWVCRSCFSFKWTVITRVANHSWPPPPPTPQRARGSFPCVVTAAAGDAESARATASPAPLLTVCFRVLPPPHSPPPLGPGEDGGARRHSAE